MPIQRPIDQISQIQEPGQKASGLIWQELNNNGDLIESWNWINNQWQSNVKSFTSSTYASSASNIWGIPISFLYNYELVNFFTQTGNPSQQNWVTGQSLNYEVVRGDNSSSIIATSRSIVNLTAGTWNNDITVYQANKFSSNNSSYLQVRAIPTNILYNFVFQLNYKLIRK